MNMNVSIGYDGREVANFVLDECDALGLVPTHISLQKIVFFCHAWHLVEFGKPLVKHAFEAWDYGPVLPYLYREFKKFGSSPVTSRATKMNRFSGKQETARIDLPFENTKFLKMVIRFYAKLSPSQLVELSHCEDGPWAKVWNHEEAINPGMKIDNANILSYYSTVPRSAKVQ